MRKEMNIDVSIIGEAFHGFLHANQRMLRLNGEHITLDEFVNQNKNELNILTKLFRERFCVTVPQSTKTILLHGIQQFLVSEDLPLNLAS